MTGLFRERPDGTLVAADFEAHMAPDVTWIDDPEFAAAFDEMMEKNMTDTPPDATHNPDMPEQAPTPSAGAYNAHPTDGLSNILNQAKDEAKRLGDEVLADTELVLHHIEHALAVIFRAKSTDRQLVETQQSDVDTAS